LNTIDFFRRVLPATGNYCLTQAPSFKHTWYDSLEAMAGACERNVNEDGMYFGVAAYDDTRTRKIENVTAVKAVWFDIDAGEAKAAKHGNKVYPTQKAALAHLVEFAKWLGIGPSLIVSSGAGLHVYYTFEKPVATLAGWDLLASSMRNAAAAFGLKIDAGITTDKARILRPVGSLHSSGERVKVLYEGASVRPHDIATKCAKYAAPVTKKPSINDDLEMLPMPFAPSSVIKIATKCGWVRESLDAKGNVPEPEWRAMLGLIKHTVEGEEFAHEWSSGHSHYDDRETQRKIDGWKKAPPTCESVACSACNSCEHKGKIKSMISLGILSDREKAASLPPPEPEKEDFASMVWTPESEEPTSLAAPKPQARQAGEMQEIMGKQTKAEIIAIVSNLDQRKELIEAGILPDAFPSFKELLRHNSGTPYFIRHRKGIITLCALHKIEKKIDGEVTTSWIPVELTHQPFFLCSHVQGRGTGEVTINSVYQYKVMGEERVSEWSYSDHSSSDLYDTAAFKKLIANLGVTFADVSHSALITNMLLNFTQANLGVLRSRNTSMQVPHHMGFQYNTSTQEPMYVQGGYASNKLGVIQNCSLGAEVRGLQGRFEMPILSTDDLRNYRDEDDVFNTIIKPAASMFSDGVRKMYGSKEKSKYGLAWLLGMASPYIPFVTDEAPLPGSNVMPGMGIALSLYSVDSGVGKTSLQQVIVAAFASPEENKAGGNKETGQSAIALGVNLSRLGSLPYMLDEVTNNDAETTSQLIHKISSGRDKSRATSQGKAVERTGTWASVTTLSTNMSQRVLISQHRQASIAEQMRVVEICFDGCERGNQSEWIQIYNDYILRNRGAMGLLLGRHGVVNWDTMRDKAMANFAAITRAWNIQSSERYFAKLFSAAMLVLDTLAEYGMYPVDKKIIVDEFKQTLMATRQYLDDAVPTSNDSVDDLVAYMAPHVLMTTTETDRRGKGKDTPYDLVHNPQVTRERVKGRYVSSTKRLYLSASDVKIWMTKRGMDFVQTIKQWDESGVLVRLEGEYSALIQLGRGLHDGVLPPNKTRCICINTALLVSGLDADMETPDNVVQINPAKADNKESEPKNESAVSQ